MVCSPENTCFCTLALREKYRNLTKQLANELATYAPGYRLVVGTDVPQDFQNLPNIDAFKYTQKSILHCYNDRAFILLEALKKFPTVIMIDADTTIKEKIPDNLDFPPGITGYSENLREHIQKARPHSLIHFESIAKKMDLSLEDCRWLGESLYAVTRDKGKEEIFIEWCAKVAKYVELRGIYNGQGNGMGLAAKKAGLEIRSNDSWQTLFQITQHFDASYAKSKPTFWQQFQRRVGYHYRLNKTRLTALRDFTFYYR